MVSLPNNSVTNTNCKEAVLKDLRAELIRTRHEVGSFELNRPHVASWT